MAKLILTLEEAQELDDVIHAAFPDFIGPVVGVNVSLLGALFPEWELEVLEGVVGSSFEETVNEPTRSS